MPTPFEILFPETTPTATRPRIVPMPAVTAAPTPTGPAVVYGNLATVDTQIPKASHAVLWIAAGLLAVWLLKK